MEDRSINASNYETFNEFKQAHALNSAEILVGIMEEYCVEQKLIDDVAPGGGFFLAPGVVVDHAKPENMHAFLRSAGKFGVH